MNQTVARIVEIMFQDVELSEEVQALKDEVMNNCQERYVDMRARGMSEDEAIGAVVDSLKGMEEVIAQYPRKADASAQTETLDNDIVDVDLTFSTAQVQTIKLLLTSDDINFETSTDEYIHVYCNKEEMPNLSVIAEHGILKVERHQNIEAEANNHTEERRNWHSLSDMLGDIGKMLSNLKVNVNFQKGGSDITIAVPEYHPVNIEVHATSGDIEIDGIQVVNVLVESTSGDLTMNIPSQFQMEQLKVKGSSGDLDINANAKAMFINTVSGDVDYTGDCPSLNVHTISGDVELNGCMESVQLKTISGDADLYVAGDALRSVNCSTTSGDLTVNLPASLRGQVSVSMQTTSGDVYNRFGENMGTILAQVNMHSISGDLTIC